MLSTGLVEKNYCRVMSCLRPPPPQTLTECTSLTKHYSPLFIFFLKAGQMLNSRPVTANYVLHQNSNNLISIRINIAAIGPAESWTQLQRGWRIEMILTGALQWSALSGSVCHLSLLSLRLQSHPYNTLFTLKL